MSSDPANRFHDLPWRELPGLEYLDSVVSKLDLPENERNFMKTVRDTIDIWSRGEAYEKEMATKF
jgi:hypothetical protein